MDKNKCNSCGKPKCSCKNKEFTKAVIEIDNPEQITLMRRVTIPASMGDDTAVPPVAGKYHNVLLFYEANSKSYLYSSDGIPTLLANGITDYEQAVNLPEINGHTLLGNKTGEDLGLQNTLSVAPDTGIQLENNELSGLPATEDTIGMVKPGDGLEVDVNGTMSISDIEQYAHFFDTVADMKMATNLVAGDYARTGGFHTVNDGGGALYKITSTGTANEMDVIAVGDLLATLVSNKEVNAKQFGCYGDDTHDDTAALNATILYAYQNQLATFIPKGTYCVSSAITMYGVANASEPAVLIKGNGRNNTLIKATDSMTNVIEIASYGGNTAASNMFIRDLGVNGNSNATNGIAIVASSFTNSTIRNIMINNCSGTGLTSHLPASDVYLDSFIKIRIRSCDTGIDISAGNNTSLRIADCYTVNCTNGYKINGAYSTFENNCADGVTGTVFYFSYFRGTIINPGSESRGASIVYYFDNRSNATVVNPWTQGNATSDTAIHIKLGNLSNAYFVGGRVLFTENGLTDTFEGKLYELGEGSQLNFDKTEYSNYKLRSSGRYGKNFITNSSFDGTITNRYENRVAYIGKDTYSTDGKANPENEQSDALANAIYFGLGDTFNTLANSASIAYIRHNMQGDILLSKKPSEIGGIGWIQAEDMTAEGAGTDWRHGTYLKIPVVHSGATADRPTTSMQVGQMYYDTTLNKPIWYKGNSVWVDATGTSV